MLDRFKFVLSYSAAQRDRSHLESIFGKNYIPIERPLSLQNRPLRKFCRVWRSAEASQTPESVCMQLADFSTAGNPAQRNFQFPRPCMGFCVRTRPAPAISPKGTGFLRWQGLCGVVSAVWYPPRCRLKLLLTGSADPRMGTDAVIPQSACETRRAVSPFSSVGGDFCTLSRRGPGACENAERCPFGSGISKLGVPS